MKQVQLVCGSLVDSQSEAWRHECEARSILAMATPNKRKARLQSVRARRGAEAETALRRTMTTLWAYEQAAMLRGFDAEKRARNLERIGSAMGADVERLVYALCVDTPLNAINDSSKRAA